LESGELEFEEFLLKPEPEPEPKEEALVLGSGALDSQDEKEEPELFMDDLGNGNNEDLEHK
ncbi:hypothetical protein P7K49_038560, partial [Saguinus oedipus]